MPFPHRPYGKSQLPLSVIGLGGIVVMNTEPDHAARTVAHAVERGINYFDVAPTYGNSEDCLGPALQPFRKNCFLACKSTQRTAAAVRTEMAASLHKLRTDYFDLYQLHGITDVAADVDAAFAQGGAMEALLEAKKSGRVRHLGFSAHSLEAALMAMQRYDFDSMLFPVNFITWYQGGFGPTVLDAAKQKGLSVLALKMFGRQKRPPGADRKKFPKCWYEPLTDPREQELAVKFTLSQPVTAAIPPGDESLFWQAVDLAEKFTPITPAQTAELKTLAETLNPLFQSQS